MSLISRRLGLAIFFSALFLAAASAFFTEDSSGTHAAMNQVEQEAIAADQTGLRESSLEVKELQHKNAPTTYISSESIEAPETLEEVIDFEQYPTVEVVATGYTAGYESTGKTASHPEYGITFSGVEVTRDLYSTIAADLNVFPIGTVLYIPSYGYGVVADKGSAITGNKIDLYYENVEDVYNEWGKQQVEVYVIEMGEGHLSEEVLLELNEDEAMQFFRSQIRNE